jgi:flavorubredoxin
MFIESLGAKEETVETVQITSQVTAIVTPMPIPGLGVLPVNAFVLMAGAEPVLVDTCVTSPTGEFVAALSAIVDPADIRHIWLTHADRDHTGALTEILAAAPNAKVVTNFISVGHLMTGPEPLPMDRVHLVNDGQQIDIGSDVVAIRPPLFDNPGTLGFFDRSTGILVSSDFCGATMPSEEDALASDLAAVADEHVTAGQLLWGSADSPWVHSIDQSKFAAALDALRGLDPQLVLSTHSPAIHKDFERHLDTLRMLPSSERFVAPDQAALEAMLAELEPSSN